MAITETLTYGVLPSREEFETAFDQYVPGIRFEFDNDPRVGTCALTASELWEELVKAREESLGVCSIKAPHAPCSIEAAGQWCSDVLSVLGFEWV